MKKIQESISQQPSFIKFALLFVTLGIILFLFRFFMGLGVTNMSAGYPWGIWIVIDVVVGTAIGTGGFVMAILVYIFNKGEYHPLVRSAILTSAFGYTIAGISVIVDLGRWWNFFSLMFPWRWNVHSVLLEVALCVMAYVIVLWIEFSPAFHEKGGESGVMSIGFIRKLVNKVNEKKRGANKILIVVVSLGILLPLMHQSSLGTVMVIAKTKLHPLWHTPFLPLLFLISIGFMGFCMVAIESLYSSMYLNRKYDVGILTKLSTIIAITGLAWIVLRFAVLAGEGKTGLIASSGSMSAYFMLEIATAIIGTLLMFAVKTLKSPRIIFISSLFLVFSAALYRINTYIVGYNPGSGYSYTPSLVETLGTFALISAEFLLYLLFIRTFPVVQEDKH